MPVHVECFQDIIGVDVHVRFVAVPLGVVELKGFKGQHDATEFRVAVGLAVGLIRCAWQVLGKCAISTKGFELHFRFLHLDVLPLTLYALYISNRISDQQSPLVARRGIVYYIRHHTELSCEALSLTLLFAAHAPMTGLTILLHNELIKLLHLFASPLLLLLLPPEVLSLTQYLLLRNSVPVFI